MNTSLILSTFLLLPGFAQALEIEGTAIPLPDGSIGLVDVARPDGGGDLVKLIDAPPHIARLASLGRFRVKLDGTLRAGTLFSVVRAIEPKPFSVLRVEARGKSIHAADGELLGEAVGPAAQTLEARSAVRTTQLIQGTWAQSEAGRRLVVLGVHAQLAPKARLYPSPTTRLSPISKPAFGKAVWLRAGPFPSPHSPAADAYRVEAGRDYRNHTFVFASDVLPVEQRTGSGGLSDALPGLGR